MLHYLLSWHSVGINLLIKWLPSNETTVNIDCFCPTKHYDTPATGSQTKRNGEHDTKEFYIDQKDGDQSEI